MVRKNGKRILIKSKKTFYIGILFDSRGGRKQSTDRNGMNTGRAFANNTEMLITLLLSFQSGADRVQMQHHGRHGAADVSLPALHRRRSRRARRRSQRMGAQEKQIRLRERILSNFDL